MQSADSSPLPTVLFADDDSNDRAMLRHAITTTRAKANYQFVHDGVEVLDYFNGKGVFKDRSAFPLPTVLVLDLSMPRMNGLEVIAELQRSESLTGVAVCIFTANEDPAVRAAVTQAKARLVTKPSLPNQWRDLVLGIEALAETS